MSVKITIDAKELKSVQRRLGELADKAPDAVTRALNRTLTNVKSNATKEVTSDYHVKAKDVKETLKDFKASRTNLMAEVKSSGKVIGLDHFKVSPKTVNPKRKSQLKIAVKKGGVKQILGAFIADLHGAKVFTRDTEKRLPISRKFGPSIPQMLGSEKTAEKINQAAYETYKKRIDQEIKYILDRV